MRLPRNSSYPAIVFAFAVLACGPLEAGMSYIALGDSSTFGNDESRPASMTPNDGDQGYVRPFADYLATLNGGVRPELKNLAISGELASSFKTAMTPADWPNRQWSWNTHYPNAGVSQDSLMVSALVAAHAANNAVYVTLNFGSNDFAELLASDAWNKADAGQQQMLFGQLLNQIALDYVTVLSEIQFYAPGAHIFLPNFFDNLLPNDPGYALGDTAALAANQILQQQIAPAFGAKSVDFYSVVHGNESTLLNATGDHHLNQTGYDAVARVLEAAAVPEPASLAMLGLGLGLAGTMAGCGWRRRRPAVAGRCGS